MELPGTVLNIPPRILPSRDTEEEQKRKEEKKQIDELIFCLERKKQKGAKEHHFRPVSLDGIYCYFVFYLLESVFTVEAINVKCNVKINGNLKTMPYILYHHKYKNFKQALLMIKEINKSYKIMNGDLLSAQNYKEMRLEEAILPYSPNEVCCVCLENTTDTTTCDHYICLSCRDKCIIKQKPDCPICRRTNVLPVYCNTTNLINNRDFSDLYKIFSRKNHSLFDSDSDSESESSDSESDSDLEDEQELPVPLENHVVVDNLIDMNVFDRLEHDIHRENFEQLPFAELEEDQEVEVEEEEDEEFYEERPDEDSIS